MIKTRLVPGVAWPSNQPIKKKPKVRVSKAHVDQKFAEWAQRNGVHLS